MRRILFALAPFVTAAIVFACEDDPTASPTQIVLPEAGLVDIERPDQRVNDAQPPPTAVSVRVVGRNGPKAGVTIVFHDGLGAPYEAIATGADGRATRAQGAEMVTALLSAGSERQLVTWTGVLAGEELLVADIVDASPIGSYDVSLPFLFADAGPFGASRYTAIVGDCEASNLVGLTINLPVRADCVAPANNAILVRADEDIRTMEQGLGYSFAKGVAAPDGGAFAVATNAWQHRADFSVDLANKPALGASASLYEIAGATAISNGTAFGLDTGPAVFRTARGFADALVAIATVQTATPGSSTALGERFVPAAGVTSKSFDFAERLPEIAGQPVDTSDPRRPFFAWTAPSAIDSAARGGIAELALFANDQRVRWSFIVAPGAKNVRAPSLPSPAADDWLGPPASSFGVGQSSVLFVDSPAIVNAGTFRTQAGIVFAPSAKLLFSGIPNGTFRVTRWVEPSEG